MVDVRSSHWSELNKYDEVINKPKSRNGSFAKKANSTLQDQN